MNTVWLRSLMRRYGIPGLLFVGAYLAVYTLWKRGVSPLRAAARRGTAIIGIIVIGSSSLSPLVGNRPQNPETDFIAAIRHKQFSTAINMLEQGADPNDVYTFFVPCASGSKTALELAVEADQVPLVEALFRHGVHPDVTAEFSALSIASLLEKEDMLKVLLAHGLHINTRSLESSRTVLMEIVWSNNPSQGARRLLDAGADVNLQDSWGVTALMFASLKGDLSLVRLLLANGADPNKRCPDGTSARSWARTNTDPALVTLLKQYGAHE
ncbi:MAG: ankyrin repeat, and basic leucine zipper protein 1 [Chthonomonadales bacterium]|nr:ankyrin repeat, and basic leucine zipper protein 1 [Chthonomonadales bacterium]